MFAKNIWNIEHSDCNHKMSFKLVRRNFFLCKHNKVGIMLKLLELLYKTQEVLNLNGMRKNANEVFKQIEKNERLNLLLISNV